MSIKIRVLIPLIIIAILVASTVLVSNIMLFSKYIDEKLYGDLDRALTEMLNEIDLLEVKAAHIASLYYSNDPSIIRAMETENRQLLLSHAIRLSEETDVEFCVITDISGRVLVRSHAPQMYGDDASIMYSIQSALSGMPLATTECDITVDMGACSSSPVYNEQGRLLGAVVVGYRLDTKEFVDKQKKIANCEISVFRGDTRVATTILNEDGTRAIGTRAPDTIIQKVLNEGESHSGHVKIFNKNALSKYIPIANPDGKVIGMLLVGHFLQQKTDTIWSFVEAGLISTFVVLLVSVLFTSFITLRITEPIKIMLDKVHYDGLTGIYNRRYFDENLDRILKSMSRSRGSLSLLMIDIDFFKKYNDTYGHSKGDECLVTVAMTLKQSLKRSDDFVARYGGEEFVVVMPNTDEKGAESIANELLENIQNCKIKHEKSDVADHITISIGVTTGNVDHTQSPDDYVKQADEMLYKSKQDGRNRITTQVFR